MEVAVKEKRLTEKQEQVLRILATKKCPIYVTNIAEEIYGKLTEAIRIKKTIRILKEGGYIEWGYDHRLDRNGWVISYRGREYLKTCKAD